MINKPKHHQRTSLPPCREAKQRKKVGLSVFVAAMLCMGIAAQAATITVNSSADALTDSDKCTLRGAVSSVNAGSNQNNCVAVVSPDAYGSNDTITFDTTVFSAATTIMVSPQIEISKDITIDGLLDVNDAPLITLDGNLANRILNFSGSVLTVSGLAFQRGSVAGYDSGGAIYASGDGITIVVRNSTFENNQTSGFGGAIDVYGSGTSITVIVRNSTFESNRTRYDGGAIYARANGGTVSVSNSVFINNRVEGSDGSGGAIYAYANGGTVSVSNSVFINNRGEGLDGLGGAVYASAATVNVSDSTFTGNWQEQGDYYGSLGGAIYAYAYGGSINVSNSTFDDNWAEGSFDSRGGAIFAVAYGGSINVSNSTFDDNWLDGAPARGGAIYASASGGTINVSNSTFESNQSDWGGGAIYADGTAHVSNSTFKGNQANEGYGGAIYALETLEASHLTLLDNSAGQNGAAIFMYDDSSGSIHNSLILSSTDLVDAPTLCAVGGAGSIGGSYNIEWVNGTDTTSCSNTNNVSGGSGAIGAIVETTLADNGGPTLTLALPAGSPAIGAVDPSGATSQMLVIDFSLLTATWEDATLDQRGITRAAMAAERSLGAFEYKAPPPPVNATPIPVLPAPLALLLALGLAVVGIGFRKRKMTKTGIF